MKTAVQLLPFPQRNFTTVFFEGGVQILTVCSCVLFEYKLLCETHGEMKKIVPELTALGIDSRRNTTEISLLKLGAF